MNQLTQIVLNENPYGEVKLVNIKASPIYHLIKVRDNVTYQHTLKGDVEVPSINNATLSDIITRLHIPVNPVNRQKINIRIFDNINEINLSFDALILVNLWKRVSFGRKGIHYIDQINVKTGIYESAITAVPNNSTNIIILAYSHDDQRTAVYYANMPEYINPTLIRREVRALFSNSPYERVSCRAIVNFRIKVKNKDEYTLADYQGASQFYIWNHRPDSDEPKWSVELTNAASLIFGADKNKLNIGSLYETSIRDHFDKLLTVANVKVRGSLISTKKLSLNK